MKRYRCRNWESSQYGSRTSRSASRDHVMSFFETSNNWKTCSVNRRTRRTKLFWNISEANKSTSGRIRCWTKHPSFGRNDIQLSVTEPSSELKTTSSIVLLNSLPGRLGQVGRSCSSATASPDLVESLYAHFIRDQIIDKTTLVSS